MSLTCGGIQERSPSLVHKFLIVILKMVGCNKMAHSLLCTTILCSLMYHKDVVLVVVLCGQDLRKIMYNDNVAIVGALSKMLHVSNESSSLCIGQVSVLLKLLSLKGFLFRVLILILSSKFSIILVAIWACCRIVDVVNAFFWQH